MSAARTVRGVVTGSLALALLQLLVSSSATGQPGVVGSIITNLTKVINRYMDPSIPLIPDLSNSNVVNGSGTEVIPGSGSYVPPGQSTTPAPNGTNHAGTPPAR